MSTSDRETGRQSRRRRCPCLLARDQGYNGYACWCFFFIFARIFGAGWTFWEPFFLLFAVSVAQRSESIVCILSIAVWRGAFCLWSWRKTKFGEEMTGSQWRSSSWSEESWPEVCVHDDGIFLWWIVGSACEDASRRCALWKKKVSDEQRKKEECSQSKRSTCKNRACKIFAPKWQQKIVCSVIALLAMNISLAKRQCKCTPRLHANLSHCALQKQRTLVVAIMKVQVQKISWDELCGVGVMFFLSLLWEWRETEHLSFSHVSYSLDTSSLSPSLPPSLSLSPSLCVSAFLCPSLCFCLSCSSYSPPKGWSISAVEIVLSRRFSHSHSCFPPTGNGIGDVCRTDYDGDGMIDSMDPCPYSPAVSSSNFTTLKNISIPPNTATSTWHISDLVRLQPNVKKKKRTFPIPDR